MTIGSPNGASSPRPKPPRNPFTPANPTPSISTGLFVEYGHSGITKDRADLLWLSAFIIMISENSDDRDRASAEVLGEDLRLTRLAEIGEVAAQHQHVCFVRDFGK